MRRLRLFPDQAVPITPKTVSCQNRYRVPRNTPANIITYGADTSASMRAVTAPADITTYSADASESMQSVSAHPGATTYTADASESVRAVSG